MTDIEWSVFYSNLLNPLTICKQYIKYQKNDSYLVEIYEIN